MILRSEGTTFDGADDMVRGIDVLARYLHDGTVPSDGNGTVQG